MSRIIRELLEATVLALLVFFVIQVSVRNFRVEGHSMEPALNNGEHLIVNKIVYAGLDVDRISRLVPFWDRDGTEKKYFPFAHPPDRGDLIVFHSPVDPHRDFVKRVIGLPGERIEIRSGEVFVDGVILNEPYLERLQMDGDMACVRDIRGAQLDLCRLGPNEYFALGDNRDVSNDSRFWGPVRLEQIVGEVWFVYWPIAPLPFIKLF